MTLEALLNSEITRFGSEARKHKRQWRTGRNFVIVLMGLAAVCSSSISIFAQFSDWLSFSSALFSTASISITSWLEMRKSFELWKTETSVHHALLDIKRVYETNRLSDNWATRDEIKVRRAIHAAIQSGGNDWKSFQAK